MSLFQKIYDLGQNIYRLSQVLVQLSLHHKLNKTRLLLPESECTSCFMTCRTGEDVRSEEIRKFQKNP